MIGRLARTVRRLHPLQIVSRIPHAIVARVVRDVPGAMAPHRVEEWPAAPEALRRLANAERARGADRLGRLPLGSHLRAYEACYGLELGADDEIAPADWSTHVAIEPYPASVRARRIAVAIRCGRRGLEGELARAARAVLLQPELHLLGNHLLENGFALACAGAATRGAEAELWWSVGAGLLTWQLAAQFLPDGGHIERSASYHVALTAALLETIEMAAASGREAPREWRELVSRAIGWASAVRAPDGTYPLFNDAALDAAPSIDDVVGLSEALGISSSPVARVESAAGARLMRLESTGWVRLDVGDACVVVDAGPDAEGWQPGHAHADGLTLEMWIQGERAIVDYGVATYEPGVAREATRATQSHNTVELNGRNSCEVWGAFRVGRRGRGRIVACEVRDGEVRADLEHDGYAWLPGSPRHARSMTLRGGCLDVLDRLRGGEGEWTSRLRLDALMVGRVRVSGRSDVPGEADLWYPRHGDARAAMLFEQQAKAAASSELVWRVEW
jgi:hypothetical protein